MFLYLFVLVVFFICIYIYNIDLPQIHILGNKTCSYFWPLTLNQKIFHNSVPLHTAHHQVKIVLCLP